MESMQAASSESRNVLPFHRKFFFGIGGLGDSLLVNAIGHISTIYNLVLQIDMLYIGIVMAIPRLWDAITDPIMGQISDNTRSRWGRRRPYVLVGGLLTGLIFFIMCSPPTFLASTGALIYLLVLSILFFTAYTVFSVCYSALGLEMSLDYHERTRVFGFRAFFVSIGGFLSSWGLVIAFWKVFPDEMTGARVMGLLFGGVAAIAMILPALGTREAIEVQAQEKMGIWRALKYTFSNVKFLVLCIAMALFLLGFLVTQPLQVYVNFFYVFAGDKEAGAQMSALGSSLYNVLALVTIVVITWVGTKLGKTKTFGVSLAIAIIGNALTWFLFTPAYPYLQLVAPIVMAFAMPAVQIFPQSILADICDLDELKTGLRREGMYGASLSFILKGTIAATQFLQGIALTFAGFNEKLEVQPDNVLLRMRVMMVLVPVVLLTLSGLMLYLLQMPEERIREVRRTLDARRAANAPVEPPEEPPHETERT